MISDNIRFSFLLSYAYFDDTVRHVIDFTSKHIDWLIDSGAFTNFRVRRQNAANNKDDAMPVTIEDYIDECKNFLDGRVWQYIALDVILNPEESMHNLDKMVSVGLKPMPVFVERMSNDTIKDLMKVNDRLCVAGAVTGTAKYLMQRFSTVYELSEREAKIHALGLGHRAPYVFRMPISSGDSTTWNNGSLYGSVKMWDDTKNKWFETRQILAYERYHKDELNERDYRILSRMHEYGIKPQWWFDNSGVYTTSFYSIASLVSIIENFKYIKVMDRRKKTYVMALGGVEHLCPIAAAILCERRYGRFDYTLVRELTLNLKDDLRNNFTAWVAEIKDAFCNEKKPIPEHRL